MVVHGLSYAVERREQEEGLLDIIQGSTEPYSREQRCALNEPIYVSEERTRGNKHALF